jgi:hypothetical protein
MKSAHQILSLSAVIAAVALASLSALAASPTNAEERVSVYTSVNVKNCLVIGGSSLESKPEIDWLDAECQAFAGYRVFVRGGDLRYSLSLQFNGAEIELPIFTMFHDLGSELIEWRGTRNRETNTFVFDTLIYRMSLADADPSQKDAKELLVVRLNGEKSCLVGSVDARKSKDANDLARQIADSSANTCTTHPKAQARP